MAKLLIVDDDLLFCEALGTTLEEAGYHVLVAHTLARARVLLKNLGVDVVFIDVFLPDGNGLDLLAGLALLPEPPEAIVITAKGDPEGAETAIAGGAWDYVQKPAHMGNILLMVQSALETRERKKQMPDFSGVSGIVAASRPMRITLIQMFEAAQSESPALITGETGTGKELVARAIHKNSRRANGPFVVVDCGAIAPTLLESELFGNVRGAFTGAVHSRHGLVMLADSGTLFLDEVGELAPAQQKVFLRLLQERSFRPIGSTEELRSDFRVVAATNRNLTEMAAAGTFRPDLLFRLQGVSIEVPPVRLRGEDVALLVQFALGRTISRYGMRDKSFSEDAMAALAFYTWPGNVREMLHTVEMAALASGDAPLILLQHLPRHLRAQAVRSRLEERGDSGGRPDGFFLHEEKKPLPLDDSGNAAPKGLSPVPESRLQPQAEHPAHETGTATPFSLSSGADSSTPTEAERAAPQAVRNGAVHDPQGPSESFLPVSGRNGESDTPSSPGTWKEFQATALGELKRRYFLRLLQFSGGSVPLAAKTAGLSRQRLYTLLREHGITRQWED